MRKLLKLDNWLTAWESLEFPRRFLDDAIHQHIPRTSNTDELHPHRDGFELERRLEVVHPFEKIPGHNGLCDRWVRHGRRHET